MVNIEEILESSKSQISSATDIAELDAIRVRVLGKSGSLTAQMQNLATLSIEQKKEFGSRVNKAKNELQNLIAKKREYFDDIELDKKLDEERLDITLPGRSKSPGSLHPTMHALEELLTIFGSLGFEVKTGPSIDNDWYNFTALNIPETHPARQMHDTFYMKGGESLLRTHTSTVQIRSMENNKPPFKIVAPGRVYRCDSDVTHTPMFHQLEILHIDKNLHMGHLKSLISDFIDAFFEQDDIPVRLRPSFFPFTEPSAEVDIGCSRKDGKFSIGSDDSWLEVLGCGMVHPNVLKNVGIDPNEYQGYALGLGIDRMAMLKYGISDLRSFFAGDKRWIDHYNFSAIDVPSLLGGLTK